MVQRAEDEEREEEEGVGEQGREGRIVRRTVTSAANLLTASKPQRWNDAHKESKSQSLRTVPPCDGMFTFDIVTRRTVSACIGVHGPCMCMFMIDGGESKTARFTRVL